MTRRDSLKTVHEPFGDAWYFGPERLAERYANDEEKRAESGFSDSTYNTIMEEINRSNTEGKRLFIKDMAQYLFPPNHRPTSLAPSLLDQKRGVGTSADEVNVVTSTANGSHFETKFSLEDGEVISRPPSAGAPYKTVTEDINPTVVPTALLNQFHFAFLIRHPRYAIPSYYRCCIPPLEDMTGFHKFRPDEAGFDELRRLFDYLRTTGQIGPKIAGREAQDDGGDKPNGAKPPIEICVIDADDLLDDPRGIMSAFCKSIGVEFKPEMLVWDSEEHQQFAAEAFEKWKGFHEDAINSTDLHARENKRIKTDEELYADWVGKYGEQGAETIRKTAEACTPDYEYLKSFAIKL